MLELLASPASWVALATLTLLEIVLGIDNVIFLSILVEHVPAQRRRRARLLGLTLAMFTRLALLLGVVWLARLTTPLLNVLGRGFSARDLILGAGGLFLLAEGALEIHHMFEGAGGARHARVQRTLGAVLVQIALLDMVFSLDSVFTAVGLARPDQLPIMVAAIVLSIMVMMWLSASIAAFIARYPGMKVLALAFLVLIGAALVCEAMEFEVPKAYLYFAMAFAFTVELINIRARRA
jgi:predicted tellurium resistance membrane protein TerC